MSGCPTEPSLETELTKYLEDLDRAILLATISQNNVESETKFPDSDN